MFLQLSCFYAINMSSAQRQRIARAQKLVSALVRSRQSISFLWMCELPEIHISSSLQGLTQSLETFFIFLYHCIFGQSFYAVQRTVHPTNCDIVYKQTATWLEKNKSNFKFSEASSLVGFGWLVVGFAIKPIFSPSPPPLMTTIATNL